MCHEPEDVQGKGDECGYHTPEFHLQRVPYPREMTMTEACVFCHNKTLKENRDEGWAWEVMLGLMVRFMVD